MFDRNITTLLKTPKPFYKEHLSGEDFQEHFSELHFGEL